MTRDEIKEAVEHLKFRLSFVDCSKEPLELKNDEIDRVLLDLATSVLNAEMPKEKKFDGKIQTIYDIVAELKRDNSGLNNTITKLTERMNEMQHENSKLKEDNSCLKENLKHRMEDVATYQATASKLEEENAKLHKDLHGYAYTDDENKKLKDENEQLRQQIEGLRGSLKEIKELGDNASHLLFDWWVIAKKALEEK